MNRSKMSTLAYVGLTLALAISVIACETRSRSRWSYSGSYTLCNGDLIGSQSSVTFVSDTVFTEALNVHNAQAKYQVKFKVGDKMYKPDLPQTMFLVYQQWRPDSSGSLQQVGSTYQTQLNCSKGGNCKSQKNTFFWGFDAQVDDVLRVGFRLADNLQGSPAIVRDGTIVDFKYGLKFD